MIDLSSVKAGLISRIAINFLLNIFFETKVGSLKVKLVNNAEDYNKYL